MIGIIESISPATSDLHVSYQSLGHAGGSSRFNGPVHRILASLAIV